MKNKIINTFGNSTLAHRFLKAPSPSKYVFLFDLLVVALCCFITYAFSPSASLQIPGWIYTPFAQGFFAFLIYVALMPVVHTYRYIIRLSVLEDMYRIVVLSGMAICTMLFIASATYIYGGFAYFGLWNIFVMMLLTFTLLMLSRLAIKYIYRQLANSKQNRLRAIALGPSANALSFATLLNNDPECRYNIVAALVMSPDDKVKTFNDIPVYTYNHETIADIFDKHNCDNLVFPSGQLKLMQSGVADEFLKCHIHLNMFTQIKEIDPKSGLEKPTAGSVRSINIEDLLGRDVIKPDTTEVESVLRDQVVMVTGAAGSIGSEIVNQVANLHASEIILLDQAETPMHELQLLMEANHPETKIHLFIADVSNAGRIEQAFRRYRPRYVFHAAAYKHVPMMERNPSEAILTNVFGTKNLADLSIKYNVEKFVMISTDKAVNPTNVMGASKRIAEIYVQSLFFYKRSHNDGPSTRFITTRFGNVLGSNGSVIPLFRKQIEQGGPVTVTHRDIIRYFMTIPEACSLVLQAGTMGKGGEIFVFDMGQPVKIYDLATRMISLSGLRPGSDIEIVETGLRPGEKLYEELLNDKEMTMATRHNKIMIAKVRVYDYMQVNEHLDTLRNLTELGEYYDIVAEMKHIVPEFHSKNSLWEKVDEEIVNETEKNIIQEISL